ncbi:MAG: type II and III secretion system protein, partial [Verrucomicrobia bacterium]|nr:type II and III secretion system protein [Verrucomicrobiota bacterium]
VKVLARPSIQTSQNAPASIFVGETRPYITGTYYDGYNSGSRSQYQQSQIGITLNVTPLINPDGLVVMDIQQQVQQVGGSVKIDNNDVPITQDQNASAKVAVRNGETIVMGGFIQNQKSESKSGVPFLQDIPWLGALFRSTSTTGARRELLVMIRPTVLPTPEAAALQTQIQRDSHPNLKEAEAAFNKEDAKLLKRANRIAKPQPADKKAAEAANKAVAEADKAAAIAEAKAIAAAEKAAAAEAKADALPAAPQDDKP